MSTNNVNLERPSANVPTTGQTTAATQAAGTQRTGKTASGVSDNLTVKRESASPQYSANVAAGGPELPAPPSNVNATDLMAILFGLRQKHTESSIENAEQRISDRSTDKDLKSKEMISKLKKIAHSKPGVGSILAKVFSWVGVALSFIVAAVVGAVSGGAAAAPLLMLAAVSAGMLIAQQSGLMEMTMDAMGMDDNAKMGLSIGIAAVMLVANIAGMVASGGSSVVSAAVNMAKTATGAVFKVAASAGTVAAKTVAKVSTSVAETATKVAVEGATKAAETATKVAVEGATKAAEAATKVAVEGATKAAETATKVAVEGATKATETATKVAVEGATKATETVAKTATKAVTPVVKTVAEKLGTTSSSVMKVVDKVRSSITIAHGVTEISTGALTIDSASKSYQGTMARAGAMRDKAVMAKMQAQDEEDMRQIRNMIQQLENAQSAVMSTITKSSEMALQIRRTI